MGAGSKNKVVLDTNIFISAFGWDGKPEEVVLLIESGKIINHINADIFDELRRVVVYPKLAFSELLQIKILEFVFLNSIFVPPHKQITKIIDDPDDNRILECAVAAEAEYIITGDPHLLQLQSFNGIKIVNVREFLKNMTE